MRKGITAIIMFGLLLALQISGLAAPSDETRLFPVKRGNLEGFINVNGTVIIPPQFAAVGEFEDDLAPAQDAGSGKWGYIDRTGTFVLAPQFMHAFPFSEGLAEVWLEPTGGGYIDYSGRLVIRGSGGPVRDGLVRIKTKQTTIFADKTGAMLFDVSGDAWPVGGGLIAFVKNGWIGFMDRQGVVIIQPRYHCDVNWRDRQFEERITPVSTLASDGKEKFGFIDISGKTVVDFQYDWAEQFFDGLAMVSKNGKHGYVNTAGEVVIPLQFDEASTRG